MELEWYHYGIAIVGSFFAGVINTLAGSGSAITLTILTELLGLPGNMANGTNRLGVLSAGMAGTFAFYKNGKLDLVKSSRYAIPTIIGAIIGILVAVWVSNDQFKTVFQYLMVLMLFVILIKPKRWLQKTSADDALPLVVTIPIFLLLGFYGGFIQMGMGVFFLAAMVLVAKYNIIDGNAVKISVVTIYTILAVAIFQYRGMIDWYLGGLLAVGQTAGGWLTATYASKYESAGIWAYRLLVVVVIGAILKLFHVF
ncbi:MAG: sulfite exporter TauE/SafE family protein [Bacteroidota bacterium]